MVAQSLPPELSHVAQLVDSSPESLARGDIGMHTAALAAAQLIYKISLETEKSAAVPISKLLSSLSPEASAPTTRAQKRKRDEAPKAPLLAFRPTPKAGRYVDGLEMNPSKLWSMMEHRTAPLCGILDAVVAPENIIEEEEEEEEEEVEEESEEEEGEFELGEDEDEDMSGLSDEDEDEEEEEEDDDEYESDDGESLLGDTTMELSRTEDHSDSGSDDGDNDDDEAPDGDQIDHGYLHNIDLDRAQNPQKVAQRRAHPTLDDTFFSIDDFNRETEALEAQNRSSGALNDDDDDGEEDGEDVDLFMNVQDIEDTPEEANDPKYKDFFAPAPKSKLKSKKTPEKPKRKVKLLVASPPGPKRSTKVRFNEEVKVRNIKSKRTKASLLAELMEAGEEDEEDEGEDGEDEGPWASEMLDESVEIGSEEDDEEMDSDEDSDAEPSKNDLFADEEENESEAGLSTHQKRLAALSAEIQALEAENVAPKPWTMQGEATSRSRPQNALLEADLEFEHVGKVVPIITEESVKSLEERIKARIIEGRYDDVVRKRDIEAKPFLPSRMFELKDTQSEKSLAQIYEDEYNAAATGSKPIDDRDGKLAESHKEITELWDGICYKLDALSNAHFTPKQPQAKIETVTNMASASLESALPTSLSTSTLLAPEEVYTPSSSDIRARSELTPSEKKAARGRERKKRRKERDTVSSVVDAAGKAGGRQPRNAKEAKEQALNGLVKNGKGVTVVGKASKSGDAKSKAKGGEKEERDGKKFKL
ncbi:U3 small nucleolar ribonucleoprotein mpp10 [Rhizoctonia solani]|uniref:U3 small nucleolar ribonucleoprotein protein MPP10 n=1 Tax=Rhizoctonia solani TaxID=456999 RepID=A0A8H8NZ33_9AGAM|nr:U3 small nucleolar ribonucleoprotein mpp10 [Rhizoctonia solani]QRW22100.1 U3 small nucleolar ribonucleoprotein mpp10 [Rhizoctonia solani]